MLPAGRVTNMRLAQRVPLGRQSALAAGTDFTPYEADASWNYQRPQSANTDPNISAYYERADKQIVFEPVARVVGSFDR
jgi:hypothetical protein